MPTISFDAASFSIAWLACRLSSDKHDFDVRRNHTVAIEIFEKRGARIMSMSAVSMTLAWVPKLDDTTGNPTEELTIDDEEGFDLRALSGPPLGAAPDHLIVVGDRDKRGASLTSYALSRCLEYHRTADEPNDIPTGSGLTISLSRGRAERPQESFAGMDAPEDLFIDFAGEERVVLDVIELESWVDYMNFVPFHRLIGGSYTESIVLSEDTISHIAKLAALSKRAAGKRGQVRLSFDGSREKVLLLPLALPGILALVAPDFAAGERHDDVAA